jgi:Tfp pilus assembly protein PilN
MIDTNLSTRPFYNERSVTLAFALVGLIVLAATAWNVSSVLRYSGSSTELASKAASDEARADEARREAARLRGAVDLRQIESASVEARQANDLIDRRTFSWTELFNRFETTLPDDARIVSVAPRIDRQRNITLQIAVLARSVDDVNQFMERLDATGNFSQLRAAQERTTEAGQIETVLETQYRPSAPPVEEKR